MALAPTPLHTGARRGTGGGGGLDEEQRGRRPVRRTALTFWIVTAALAVVFAVILWIGYSRSRPAAAIRRLFAWEVSFPARGDPPDLYTRPFPPRLSLNWAALVLGPLWYFFQGLWVHGVVLASLVFVSGGLLAPLVWLYAGLKANEDLLEFRIASRSYY